MLSQHYRCEKNILQSLIFFCINEASVNFGTHKQHNFNLVTDAVKYDKRPKMKRDAQLKAFFLLGKRLLYVGHLSSFFSVRPTLQL